MSIVNDVLNALTHPVFMLLAGLLTHFGRKVLASQSHSTTGRPCFTDYWKAHPLQSGLSLIGAGAGYVLFVHEPDFSTMPAQYLKLASVAAFGIGFSADSIADAIGERTARRISMLPDNQTPQGPI